MAQPPNDADELVAKMMAMEILLLTLVRPVAGNPKFWDDVDAIMQGFQQASPQVVKDFPHRIRAAQESIDQWRRAFTPPAG